MEPSFWNAPLKGAEELAAVLDFSGVAYEREESRFYFRFSGQGCRWQMVCDGAEGRVMIYAIHPTPVRCPETAYALCSEINRQVIRGCCFVQEERIVFRTEAELIEACAAREAILQALEYNAAVMTTFWSKMAKGAAGLTQELSMDVTKSHFGI